MIQDGSAQYKIFVAQALIVVFAAAAVIVGFLALWQIINVLLIGFGGILFAVFLRTLTVFVHRYIGLNEKLSLFGVLVVLIALTVLVVWLFAPSIAEQSRQISQELPRAVERFRVSLEGQEWAQFLIAQIPEPDLLQEQIMAMLGHVGGLISRTMGGVVDIFVLLFIGIYLAYDPKMYMAGVARLVPFAYRDRAHEIMSILGCELQRWLMTRLLSMIAVGIMVSTALWFFDMPMILILGVVAAILDFVPIIGPIIAAIPAILLALLISPTLAVYVALVYWVIQQIEGYILTPILHQQVVSLSPALVIVAQVSMAVLLGVNGLVFATPLLLVAVVFIKLLYIEDILGDSVNMSAER